MFQTKAPFDFQPKRTNLWALRRHCFALIIEQPIGLMTKRTDCAAGPLNLFPSFIIHCPAIASCQSSSIYARVEYRFSEEKLTCTSLFPLSLPLSLSASFKKLLKLFLKFKANVLTRQYFPIAGEFCDIRMTANEIQRHRIPLEERMLQETPLPFWSLGKNNKSWTWISVFAPPVLKLQLGNENGVW